MYIDLLSGSDTEQRVRRFLNKYDAPSDGNNRLNNKDNVAASFEFKSKVFAAVYLTVRMKDKKQLSTDARVGITRHLGGASKEIAAIFVDALMSAFTSGSNCLKCASDPEPTAPGPVFDEWKIFRDAFDVIDTIVHELETDHGATTSQIPAHPACSF